MSQQYLILQDRPTADARNASEAHRRGCGLSVDDATQYWWEAFDHPTNGTVALVILDTDQAGLSSDEQAALVATLTSDWTPPNTRGN